MCGIFGLITKSNTDYSKKDLRDILLNLARYSEVRGKDSSGITFRNSKEQKIEVLKGPLAISSLLKTKEFNYSINNSFSNLAFGHARLTTNGTHLKDINNQPVIKDDIVCVHNGIIVNVEELWKKHYELKREYDIDTEVLASILRKYIKEGISTIEAIKKCMAEIFGTVATAILFTDMPEFILVTNNGSLYTLTDNNEILVFASEKYMLDKLLTKSFPSIAKSSFILKHLQSNTGLHINIDKFTFTSFNLKSDQPYKHFSEPFRTYKVEEIQLKSNRTLKTVVVDMKSLAINSKYSFEKAFLEFNLDKISNIKRCTKCLLPETFPFVVFDENGVCNICNNYHKKNNTQPLEELESLVEPYRRNDAQPDCLVPFSGGRDSTYTLHIVKKILKMNPIAFTYDWGMVTDLARRNIARVCGKLGVENIIVSANIRWKRENIRKNILAWLKRPSLGMIPLFMAGDKYFFYFTDQLKKQTGIKLNIWGINPLENTDFKVGFCGVPLRFNKKRIYSLSLSDQFRLFAYVGKNIINSPSYINQSIFDTLGSFAVRYIAPRKDYYHLFDYYKWDEKEIENLIFNEYKWEKAIDTTTTWRIGDGTAAFYNYIYYTVAGFSEYDTFRSNQIREGMIYRENALKMVNEENRPRYESIKWYTEIIGLDFETVIKQINQIPKLY